MGGEWTHLISSKQPVFALKTYASLQPRRKNLTPGGVSRRFFCVKILWPSNMSKKWWVKTKTMCNKLNKHIKIQDISCNVGEWNFYWQTNINHPTEGSKHFPASGHGTWYPVHASTRCLGRARMVLGPEMKGLCLTEAVLQNSKMIITTNERSIEYVCIYSSSTCIDDILDTFWNITASEVKKENILWRTPLKIDMDTWINYKTIILKVSPFPNHRFWI